MSSVNRVTLLGRLGKDPETKTFSNGGSLTNFSIATSETWKDKSSGEKKTATEWHNIVVGGPLSDVAQKYLHKGDLVYLEGKIKTRSWEQNGERKYTTEIHVSNLVMLPRHDSSSQQSQPSAPSGAAQSSFTPPSNTSFDDLPF